MSINNQCEFIKKNNKRCKRLINKDENYCWQHIDSDISESLESVETLPNELIQYVLNPYIDYSTESELIENLTNVKLDIDTHLTYENEYYDSTNTVIKSKHTYLDFKLIKYEGWFYNGNIYKIFNYNNGKYHGMFEEWYPDGNKWYIRNYKNGKLNGLVEYWYENGNLQSRRNYRNGELEGISEYWYPDGNLESRRNYIDGNLDGLYEE